MIKPMSGDAFTSKEIAMFNQQYMTVFQQLANLALEKQKLEQAEAKAKEQIEKAMDEYGIQSIDNDFIRITRVAAGEDSMTVDLKSFQEKEPNNYAELLADYPKPIKGRKAYVLFKPKV